MYWFSRKGKWFCKTLYRGCWVNFPSPSVVCPLAFFSRMNFKILIFGLFFRFWSGRYRTPSKRRSRRSFTKKIFARKKKAREQSILEKINPTTSVKFFLIHTLFQGIFLSKLYRHNWILVYQQGTAASCGKTLDKNDLAREVCTRKLSNDSNSIQSAWNSFLDGKVSSTQLN